MKVLSQVVMAIEREDDVVLVRRKIRALAQARGFDTFASAAVTTAASELTRNVWVHARRGQATLEEVSEAGRVGLRAEFRDQGPGIADIDRVLAGGFSTARSMGLGLSGSRRLVDRFTIESVVGRGTVISFIKWKAF